MLGKWKLLWDII